MRTTQLSRWLQWGIMAVTAIVVLVGWESLIPHVRGDFPHHYLQAVLLLHGKFIYPGGVNRVYPPFWAMVHVPFTVVSAHVAMLILYPFGVAAMVALVLVLKKLADRHWPLRGDALAWSTILALLLASPFLDRDLTEVGVNTVLVLFCWWGVYLWIKGRDVLGGIFIALAAAMKCMPVMFIGYFLWKRQWRIACVGAAALVGFSVLPMAVAGPRAYAKVERYWIGVVWSGMTDPDPTRTVMGDDRVGNLSLRAALARYLMHIPYGNPARPETPVDTMIPTRPPDPLYLQFFNFAPATAGRIVKVILLGIAAIVMWIFRKPAADRHDPAILWECATVSMAILLYSPLTWTHHCVGTLPALYFIFRAIYAGAEVPRWVNWILLGFFIIMIGLHQALLGRRLTSLREAYHLRNFALLGLFIAVLACHAVRRGSPYPPSNRLRALSPALRQFLPDVLDRIHQFVMADVIGGRVLGDEGDGAGRLEDGAVHFRQRADSLAMRRRGQFGAGYQLPIEIWWQDPAMANEIIALALHECFQPPVADGRIGRRDNSPAEAWRPPGVRR